MHTGRDAVVVATIPFGTINSIRVRGAIERILKDAGLAYRVVQDALTFTPGPQIKRVLIDREPPRLYVLVRVQDYDAARAAIQEEDRLRKYAEAQEF